MTTERDADFYLNRQSRRYVATGDTFRLKDDFISWGWHWDGERRAWVEDNGSDPDEPCIAYFRNKPGITITTE